MKKSLLLIAAVAAFMGCSTNDSDMATATGEIQLKVSSTPEITISSKAELPQIDDNYAIEIKNGSSTTVKSGTYGTLKNPFTLTAATGYIITAENCSETEAVSTTGSTIGEVTSYGQPRYAGNSTFNVTAGSLSTVSFTCTMKNAKVSIAYDPTFTNAFTNYSVQVYETSATSGAITFSSAATLTSPVAYFNVPATTPQLTLVITATRTSDSTPKTYTKTVDALTGANWYKLTLEASTTSGQADLDITVNTDCTEITQNVPIDPYE